MRNIFKTMHHTRLLYRLGLAVAVLGCAAVPASANLLLNGSFEDPVVPSSNGNGWITVYSGETIGSAGWIVDQNSVDVHAREYGTPWTPADGLQALDLTGGNEGIIHQDVSVTPGQDYRLSFYMSGNLAYDPQVKSLAVYADGTMLGQLDFDSAGAGYANMNWQFHAFTFTAPDSLLRVEFRSLTPGSCGPAIDDVQLTAVPEPSTWFAGLSALGMLSLFGWRNRK